MSFSASTRASPSPKRLLMSVSSRTVWVMAGVLIILASIRLAGLVDRVKWVDSSDASERERGAAHGDKQQNDAEERHALGRDAVRDGVADDQRQRVGDGDAEQHTHERQPEHLRDQRAREVTGPGADGLHHPQLRHLLQGDDVEEGGDDASGDDDEENLDQQKRGCLLYTSPSPRDRTRSRMP